jgi:sugar/nucleoside kinase (ribokinase family)
MRLGVLGTMVWDRIEHPSGDPVERWGGISYSLAAAAVALPDGWSVRPIIKVGADLEAEAVAFLRTLPNLELPGGVVSTREPNNRVRLRYLDHHHREERLTGGVPGWDRSELEPLLDGLDALYVNLISGFELSLDLAARLRNRVGGLVYADFHSLLLGVDREGRRVPRPPVDRDAWIAAFDVVQVNEGELKLLAAPDDPWSFAESAARDGGTVLVTRGPAGATAVTRSSGRRPWEAPPGEVRRVEAPMGGGTGNGDPTGCGDVWGATCFVQLMAGNPLDVALRTANRSAARNARFRGAEGLHLFLMEEL